MSLEILVAMVVVGVSLVVAAVSFSGLSKPARIDSKEQIRRRLANDFPETALRDGVITADRKVALFQCADGRIALAQALGSKFVTRLIGTASIRKTERGEGATMTLELDDFTFPRMRLEFASPDEADRLSGWLEAEENA